MEHASFVRMSRLLEGSGIAWVRVDLSGHGESDGDFFDVTITGEIASGYLEGRKIAPEIEAQGYFDADSHRVSPAFVEDIANLDVYGRSRAYTGPGGRDGS